MSLLDRLRGQSDAGSNAPDWDDDAAGTVATSVARLAVAWDPEPADPRVAASRAAVLGAFAAAHGAALERGDVLPGAADRALSPAGAVPGIRRGGRRPARLLLATGLVLAASVGTVAASGPGGALYDVRVATEEIFLPAAPDEQVRAQVERLDARLAEAAGAVTRGDVAAVRASLLMYARIATDAGAGARVDAATAPALALRVYAQLEILARLGAADPAIDAARSEAEGAARALLRALGVADGGPNPGPGGPSGPGSSDGQGGPPSGASPGGSGPSSSGSPGGSGGPAGPGMPEAPATPKGPGPSVAPGGSGGPGSSSAPARSPGPSLTPAATPRRSGDPGSGGGGGSDATPRPDGRAGGDSGEG